MTSNRYYCTDCGGEFEGPSCETCQCGTWLPFPATRPEPHDRHVLVYTAANNQYVARLAPVCWVLPGGKRLIDEGEVVTHWRRLLDPPLSNNTFAMSYSGFSTDSPANISVDGCLFQIHAESASEVQRLVVLLNARYGKEGRVKDLDLPVESYLLPRMDAERYHPDPPDITLERRLTGRLQDGIGWAICRGRQCMSKDGEWVLDRIPPELSILEWRTGYRWDTPQEAYEFWMSVGRKIQR